MSRLLSALSLEGPDGVQAPLMLASYRSVTSTQGLAGVKAKTSVRPAVGRNGSVNATRYRDDRLITIEGIVLDQTENSPDRVWQEWDDVQAAYAASVDTDRLMQWTAGDRDLQAHVRLEDLSEPIQVGANVIRYQAQLRNTAGLAFSQQEQVVQAASPELVGGGGMTMPATFPVTFLPVSSGIVSVTNLGGMPSPPTLVLQGGMSSPIVVCGDRRLVIEGDVSAGDELWLNAADRTVLLNGDPLVDRRNMFRSAMSRWFELPAQVPTLIRLQVTDFDSGAGLEVRFRHAY